MAEFKQIVRIINADIHGEKQLCHALTSISGVGYSFSASVCNVLNLDCYRKVGSLSMEEIKKIEDAIKNPSQYKIPSSLFNRKADPETGQDRHLLSSDLKLTTEFDIKMLKKIRSYRGIRHAMGLPVRGQRTRSNFREGKAVGVSKKKAKLEAEKQETKK